MRRINHIARRTRRSKPIGSRSLLCACVTGLALAGSGGASPAHGARRGEPFAGRAEIARVARAETLNERSQLRLTYVKGNRIVGRGLASGTIAGSGSAHLTLINADRAVGEFSGGNSNGSVKGEISASYRVAGAFSYFKGSVTGVHGTGKYANARGLSISFSGTLNRPKLTLTISAVGEWQR